MATINRLGAPLRITRPWTGREEDDLRRNYRTVGAAGMALRHKRTKAAIKLKAYELGLTRKLGEDA